MQTLSKTNARISHAPCCSEITTVFEPSLFKALADANRVSILANLAIAAQELTVSQVADAFHLNLSVVSRHLKILKEARILRVRKSGKEVRYSVNTAVLADALRQMADVLERCCPESCCDSQNAQPNKGKQQ